METPPNELDWSIPQNHNPNQNENAPMDTSVEQQIPDRKKTAPQRSRRRHYRALRIQEIDNKRVRSWRSLIFPR